MTDIVLLSDCPFMESTKKFIVLKASAGSGKTFTLVFHYLSCALRFENPSYYKHILAITFTNAAANEMKQRVLNTLKEISEGQGQSDMEKKLLESLKVSADVLKSRAQAAYSHMLHNYSKLSILTIDSFTHRLVRSFARDLQLNNDFNIEMKPENLQEKTVDRMLEFIGQDALLTQYLHRYSKYLLEEGKAWNPREGLIEMAKVLFKEDGQEPLKKLEAVDLPKIQEEYAHLHSRVRAFETEVKQLATEILELIEKAGITKEDIPNKNSGYISGLTTFIRKDVGEPLGKNVIRALENHTWLRDKVEATLIAQLNPFRAELDTKADRLIELMSEESLRKLKLMRKIKDNLYTMGLIDRMNEYAHEIRIEENMVLLGDFHRMINTIIQSNDAPFIFERIGARYKHILVDEFQDTSKMQWMNLIPLIQNCLAEGHENLIVGDAKQSIYRWRSANVEQFTMLPKVPQSFNMPLAEKTFDENIFDDDLETNYRSSESVIDFNNTIFPSLAKKLPGCSDVYSGDPQKKNSKDAGFVRLTGNHLLKKGDAGYDTFIQDALISAIEDCKKSGYRYGDITILV
ncbi:MAG: UvrD-helicase domain-containing protein, partial [Flavobacteriales bacterium]